MRDTHSHDHHHRNEGVSRESKQIDNLSRMGVEKNNSLAYHIERLKRDRRCARQMNNKNKTDRGGRIESKTRMDSFGDANLMELSRRAPPETLRRTQTKYLYTNRRVPSPICRACPPKELVISLDLT